MAMLAPAHFFISGSVDNYNNGININTSGIDHKMYFGIRVISGIS
jgi:hypothetical protein